MTAARAAGIDAIDAPYPAYQDPDGYRRSATHASLLGFDGKWAIHPDQIAIAHDVFSPTADEIDEARQAIEVYEEAEADGVGAIGRDGKLVDAAHMRLAAQRAAQGGARVAASRILMARRPRHPGAAPRAGRIDRVVRHRPPLGSRTRSRRRCTTA